MHLVALILSGLLLVAACSKSGPTADSNDIGLSTPQTTGPLVPQHLLDAYHHYSKTTATRFLVETSKLNQQVDHFLTNPSDHTKLALEAQWLKAHIAYSSAQFGIMTPENKQLHFQIDAWPIQPGFIDNLPQYPYSGVVFDKTLPISAENLIHQHGITDSEEVILGFHSLELLIFSRPLEDFTENTNEWNERRRQMMSLISSQLHQDAQTIIQLSTQYHESHSQDPMIIRAFLQSTRDKVRLAFQQSNLVAAQNPGHCLTNERSLAVLAAEIDALNEFLLDSVSLESILKDADPTTFNNFVETIEASQSAVIISAEDEVARAKLPLLLSALTHQIESFHRSL